MFVDRPERPVGAPAKLEGYEFYKKVLGNPRHIAAPMVRLVGKIQFFIVHPFFFFSFLFSSVRLNIAYCLGECWRASTTLTCATLRCFIAKAFKRVPHIERSISQQLQRFVVLSRCGLLMEFL